MKFESVHSLACTLPVNIPSMHFALFVHFHLEKYLQCVCFTCKISISIHWIFIFYFFLGGGVPRPLAQLVSPFSPFPFAPPPPPLSLSYCDVITLPKYCTYMHPCMCDLSSILHLQWPWLAISFLCLFSVGRIDRHSHIAAASYFPFLLKPIPYLRSIDVPEGGFVSVLILWLAEIYTRIYAERSW